MLAYSRCLDIVPFLAMVPRPSSMIWLDKVPWPSACLDSVTKPSACLDTPKQGV